MCRQPILVPGVRGAKLSLRPSCGLSNNHQGDGDGGLPTLHPDDSQLTIRQARQLFHTSPQSSLFQHRKENLLFYG